MQHAPLRSLHLRHVCAQVEQSEKDEHRGPEVALRRARAEGHGGEGEQRVRAQAA